MQTEARSAKKTLESAICGVLRKLLTPTGSVLWLAPISSPRKRASHERWTNLRSDTSDAKNEQAFVVRHTRHDLANVADQGPRARDAGYGTEMQSRGSLHPTCSPEAVQVAWVEDSRSSRGLPLSPLNAKGVAITQDNSCMVPTQESLQHVQDFRLGQGLADIQIGN